MFWWFCITALLGYALGYFDGLYSKPPYPTKGSYPYCESVEEQDKEYPDRWV